MNYLSISVQLIWLKLEYIDRFANSNALVNGVDAETDVKLLYQSTSIEHMWYTTCWTSCILICWCNKTCVWSNGLKYMLYLILHQQPPWMILWWDSSGLYDWKLYMVWMYVLSMLMYTSIYGFCSPWIDTRCNWRKWCGIGMENQSLFTINPLSLFHFIEEPGAHFYATCFAMTSLCTSTTTWA